MNLKGQILNINIKDIIGKLRTKKRQVGYEIGKQEGIMEIRSLEFEGASIIFEQGRRENKGTCLGEEGCY